MLNACLNQAETRLEHFILNRSESDKPTGGGKGEARHVDP